LHIPANAPVWDLCADDFNYTKEKKGTTSVFTALKGKYKMLKYSGDTDSVLPT
jgi:hypothetical protein